MTGAPVSLDAAIALGVAVAVVLLFLAVLSVQRRPREMGVALAAVPPAPHGSATETQVKHGFDGFREELASIQRGQRELSSRQTETEHHVAQLRTMMRALPSKDEVNRLKVEVAELRGDVKVIFTTTTATSRMVERIEDHLLNKGKPA